MSNTPIEKSPPKLLEQVVARIRVKHYSRRTEQAYVDWIKRYILNFDKVCAKGVKNFFLI